MQLCPRQPTVGWVLFLPVLNWTLCWCSYVRLLLLTGVELWAVLCMSVQQKPENLHLLSLPLHAALLGASVIMRVRLDRLSTEHSCNVIMVTQTWTPKFKSFEL